MLSFESDYIAGAHPAILQYLCETNLEPTSGYGSDRFTAHAAELIRKACADPQAGVYFSAGGTQTNQLVISTLLADYEGVLSAETGHIALHEAGAIEYSGHKVLPLPAHEGKVDAGELSAWLEAFYADDNCEHMVSPGMLYISQPNEYGTLYSKKELTALREVCESRHIPIYMDGARLIYSLGTEGSDLTLADIARLTDVFYIGGTKAGTLCGEAIVFPRHGLPAHFLTRAKQRGALLAKGRLVGAQFEALFTDELYLKIARETDEKRRRLTGILKNAGLPFFCETPTNQQFIILENSRYEALKKDLAVSYWEPYDDSHTVVRFAVSWSTSENDLISLEKLLNS